MRPEGLWQQQSCCLRQRAVVLYIFPQSYPRPASPAITHGLPCRPSGASLSPFPQVRQKGVKQRKEQRKYLQKTEEKTHSLGRSGPLSSPSSSWPSPPRAASLPPPAPHSYWGIRATILPIFVHRRKARAAGEDGDFRCE